jgi:putative peptidoglycan lipid II flippase
MTATRSERTEVLKSASVLGVLTVLSRILGMVRDIVCAALFGAGEVWDAFIIAWTVPNLFRRLFGEGALASTFIPVYTETLEKEGDARAREFASRLFGAQLLLLGGLTVLGVTGALLFAPFLALFGALDPKIGLAGGLTAFLMPYMLLVCSTALLAALLNAHRRFALAAAAPVVLNTFWIAGAAVAWAVFAPPVRIYVMSGFILAGGGAQALMLLGPLLGRRRIGFLRPDFKDPGVRSVARLAVPVVFGLAILQVNVLLDRVIAEVCVEGDGAVSALYFGNRLMQFPLGVIGIAVATAVFPHLARSSALEDRKGFNRLVGVSLRGTLFMAIPAAAGLMVLADGLVRLLFGHGAFADTPGAAGRTATVVVLYAAGLAAYCAIAVVTRGFYALKDTRTPVKIASVMVVLNLALNLGLVWTPLREGGLALATALTAWVNFFVSLVLLGRRQGTSWMGDVLTQSLRPLLAAGAMALGTWFLYSRLATALAGGGKAGAAVAVLGSVCAGGGLYIILCILLRDPSLKMWVARILKRGESEDAG